MSSKSKQYSQYNQPLKQYNDVTLKRDGDAYVVRQGRTRTTTGNIITALELYCKLVIKSIDKE